MSDVTGVETGAILQSADNGRPVTVRSGGQRFTRVISNE